MKLFLPRLQIVILFFYFFPVFLFGDESADSHSAANWYENIFFSISGQYYIVPDVSTFISEKTAKQYGIDEGIIAYPGFRAGVGYEWNKLRFGLETGYTYLKGDNPLVKEIVFVPLLLKAGYAFTPIPGYERFNVTPSLGFGFSFVNVEHYETVLDVITGNINRSTNTSSLLQAGFRAGWMPFSDLDKIVEVFAGFSLDSILEDDGIIPLPQIELGLIVRPFLIKKTVLYKDRQDHVCNLPHVIETEVATYTYRILFQPDTTVLARGSAALLDEAAGIIKEYDNHKITLRGYVAPYGTAPSQMDLSRQRSLLCIDHITKKHGISGVLFNVEWYGADSFPSDIKESEHSLRRSVDIIIEGWNNP